jgi:peptide-methionine (S)-S-oxide reductase
MSKNIIQSDIQDNKNNLLQIATFAAGCFWGVEDAFGQVKGVKSIIVGYTGGWFENPSYKDVCTSRTGHAEAVQLHFDPNEVSYERLLGTFWSIHNPTTKNRQGPDIGSQYRSMIVYHNQEQELVAKKSKENLERSGRFNGRTIVTEIVPATTFYKAEEYHQKYYQKTGGGGSC